MKNKLIILKDLYQRIGHGTTKDQLYRAFKIRDDQIILDQLDHAQKVQYALKCARSVVHLINHEQTKQKANKCLSLVDQWLSNPSSVTNDQLYDAAHAADAAHYAARGAADAAYCAVDAADAAYYAAYCAVDAADAAVYAAHAADAAVYVAPNQQAQIELNFKFLMETI